MHVLCHMPPCRNVLSTAGSTISSYFLLFCYTMYTANRRGTNGRKNDARSGLCSRRVNLAIDSSLLITERDFTELMNFIYCQASFNRTMSNGGRTKVRLLSHLGRSILKYCFHLSACLNKPQIKDIYFSRETM